jgi:hypothetical protein
VEQSVSRSWRWLISKMNSWGTRRQSAESVDMVITINASQSH